MNKKLLLLAAAVFPLLSLFAGKFTFECSTNQKDAIYKAGEKIVFTAKLLEDGKVSTGNRIQFKLYHDHRLVKQGTVPSDKGLTLETSSKNPAWVFIQVWARGDKGRYIKQAAVRNPKKMVNVSGGIGAMVEPLKLQPPLQEPADFDAFWNKVKAELAAVPMKVLEKKQVNRGKVNVYDIKIACAGDKPVSGYLCMPAGAKPKSCPIYVTFHGAGVRSANKPAKMAAKGVIALDINAHGIENGKPKQFYEDLKKNYYYTTLDKFRKTRYALWNRHDRDLYYFKGMYMRLMRALEYVKSLPEWDGKHLIVNGASQGGAQVIAACALDQDITFARAGVPAQCDHSGCLGNRRSGWPFLYTADEHKKNPAYAKCASYYDGAYFARRIKCPIYFYTGFVDRICPPTSVYAAYNSVPAGVFKHMQTTPTGGHGAPGTEATRAMNAYIQKALKK